MPSVLAVLRLMHQLDFRRLLDRQIGRLIAFENSPGVGADQMIVFRLTAAIAHQAAGGDEPAKFVDGGHRMMHCQRRQEFAVSREEVVGGDGERAYVQSGQGFKDRIEIALAGRVHNMELQPERRGRPPARRAQRPRQGQGPPG